MGKLRVLDLFSGIGGFSLGLERMGGFETVAFCEIEPFPQKVLRKHWPDVPIFEDIRALKGDHVGSVDLVCGGYPCQPFSHAGQRRGEEDDRHLWPEMYRLVDELRPAWVIGENVAGHVSMGLDDVLSDLEAIGYTARPFVIPACAVDARHRRDRIWIVAHRAAHGCGSGRPRGFDPSGEGQSEQALQNVAHASRFQPGRQEQRPERERIGAGGEPSDVPDTDKPRSQGHRGLRECSGERALGAECRSEPGAWLPEPDVGRVAHGVPNRVDRLKALGNAVVPQVVEMIGYAILEAEKHD